MQNVLLVEVKKKCICLVAKKVRSSSLQLKSNVKLTVFLYLKTEFY